MKSPFPGMDPYLESHWRDVHQSLCTYARDALQPQLLPALRARLEERLVVESEDYENRSIYPDVKVFERRAWEGAEGGVATVEGRVAATPLIAKFSSEPAMESFIQIIDPTSGGRLVTVIEFLSYSNKLAGEGQRGYRLKQQEYRAARVSLVEIDLLRTGTRVIVMPLANLPRRARTTYLVCVHRGWQEEVCELYPAPLREALPMIRIPLREKDADATLDLQALLELTYRNGAYDDIDYSAPPAPPLDAEDTAWADQLLRAAGKRNDPGPR